ncbi:MAG: dTMP kinase [Nanoarchaeota archaeon]|nr:dTMP kinase [Nanoarchaeota archaeon]
MDEGKFIVLEGIDGAGTSTQGPLLVKYLFDKLKKNVPVLTREPTQLSPYGKELRRRLNGSLLPGEEIINDPDYWAGLFIKDRQWHHDNLIVPSLRLGLQVISDRYKHSTIAYQSAQGKDIDELIELHQEMRIPDLTIFLDTPVEKAQQRMGKDSQRTQEYFEALTFQEKVREKYLLTLQKLSSSEKIVVIDGSQSIEVIAKEIQQEVNELYGYQ